MAAIGNKFDSRNVSNTILSLHEMFRIVGAQLSLIDVRLLKVYYSDTFPDKLSSKIVDGYTFLLAMEKTGRIDESNFHHLLRLLRIITRQDLTQYVTLRKTTPVAEDPVSDYLERNAQSCIMIPFQKKSPTASIMTTNTHHVHTTTSDEPATKRSHSEPIASTSFTEQSAKGQNLRKRKLCKIDANTDTVSAIDVKKKVSCDIRLRVRAEYCHHNSALEGNVHSNKPELTERQFERFMQANTILKSRDLGSIMCDIKFSELTYLDAFWRDYINGSLLDALKGVFITESLKQAVGHEAIKLLVNVDEDDYEVGRKQLLENLKE